MSSPYSTVAPKERKILPLPVRSRRRSGNPGSALNSLNPDGIPSKPPQSLAEGSGRSIPRFSDDHPGNSADTPHFSLPAPDVPGIDSQSGQAGSNFLPSGQVTFTFRHLHNITPRPSPEPEALPLPSLQDPAPKPGYSSLPIPSTQSYEISQPLPTTYSEEKIPLPRTSSSLERGIPVIVEDGLYATPRITHSSSITPETLVSSPRASDLSPDPHGQRQRSVSDASIASDNNEASSPYDVRDEEAPLEPFFAPAFQTALQNGLDIANRTATAIKRSMGSSEATGNLERLLNDAKKLSTFQSSDLRTIAVLGDSGEGKSSLINALLHFPEIAKTGDIGAACTSVVTEYRQKTRHHTAPITIEVEYLSKSEIEDLIKELLWNYRQIFLPDIENDKVDPKEYARFQRESEQAWSALEAAFKHQGSFNKRLLCGNMNEEGLVAASDQLIQWAHELEWPDGDNSGTWKSTANTAEECCETTSIFMQDRFWPFTKIIRVYLSSQVLKTGVVLADLPGLQDTNLARVRATQDYLVKCDNIFIVAKISRALTDQSLKSSLYSILSRHVSVEWEESGGKSLNLAVVCTKSEDIKQTTSRREFCGPDKRIPSSVIEQLDKDIENAKKSNDKALKKYLKRKQEFLFVAARNSHVKEGLQNAYSSKVPGGKLEVFCVSNTTYEKYSRKGNAEMVHASGIPELRRFCHTITASAQLREAKHFLQSTLSSLLNSVELLASSSAHPQIENTVPDESIEDALEVKMEIVRENVSDAIDKCRRDFRHTFQEGISEYLEERRNEFWEGAAGVKGEEWHSWHWTQYNAWCLNNGDHTTAKRGHVNWNSELIWKMRMELAFQWSIIEEEIPTVFEELFQSIRTCFVDLTTQLREHGFVDSLVEGIDFRIQDVEYKIKLAQQEFTREVKIIRRYASEPNQSSYIVSEMIPAYRRAAAESGTGKAARQRDIVQGCITNGTLFPQISIKIQANMKRLIISTFGDLKRVMDDVLDLVQSDIDMAMATRPERGDDSINQEDHLEESRREELMAEIEELKGEHEEVLTSIAEV